MSVQVRRRCQRSDRKARSSIATIATNNAVPAVRPQPSLLPDPTEVVAAVKSLYEDELKPICRILRKRIAERAAAHNTGESQGALPNVHGRHLREVCDASSLIRVEQEGCGEWCALLNGVPTSFVDISSPHDIYPRDLWDGAVAYFAVLDGDDMILPGGRYSFAQALAERQLPFLQGYSVGKICHIVELAISQKKILGYLSGGVVPYKHSQSMVKEQCALFKQPCAGPIKAEVLPLATWDQALVGVRNILDVEFFQGNAALPLCNVKRHFRSRFHLELSETMLGYLKISDLLQDPKFADICTVQWSGSGYNVIKQPCRRSIHFEDWEPVAEESGLLTGNSSLEADTEPLRVNLHLEEAPCACTALYAEVDGVPLFPPTPSFPPTPAVRGFARCSEMSAASPSSLAFWGSSRQIVKNTFIHAPLPPTTPMRRSRRRTQSVPRDMGGNNDEWEASCDEVTFLNRPSKTDGLSSAETVEGSVSERGSHQRSSEESSEVSVRSPVPDSEDVPGKVALEQRRPQFRPTVSLTLEEEVMASPGPAVGNWANISLTPAKLFRRSPVSRFIRNTFIHAVPPPPAPSPASAKRGHSIPRNFGSEKRDSEAARHSPAYLPNRAELAIPEVSPPAFLQQTPTPLMSPEFCRWSPAHFDESRVSRVANLRTPRSRHSKGPVLRLVDLL